MTSVDNSAQFLGFECVEVTHCVTSLIDQAQVAEVTDSKRDVF